VAYETVLREKLTAKEISEAKAFTDNMSAESGMIYKLDVLTFTEDSYDSASYILHYEDSSLDGFAMLNGFDPEETEVTFIGKTETAVRSMFDALTQSGKAKSQIAIANKDDKKLVQWLTNWGFVLSYTEYRMAFREEKFDKAGFLANKKHNLRITQDMSVGGTKFAYLNGEAVGEIMRIETAYGIYGIYGLSVKPEWQGKGIGREFLGEILLDLSENKYDKIFLEVASDNSRAIKLYEGLAFQTEAVFDYYKLIR